MVNYREGQVVTIFEDGPFCNQTGTVIQVYQNMVSVLLPTGYLWRGKVSVIAPDNWQ